MRAIQIDAGARTVAAAEYSGDFNEIYDLIDARAAFEAVGIANGDGVFVDGEGLTNAEHFFILPAFCDQPFAGNGVIIGCEMDTGESQDCEVTRAEVEANIIWLTRDELQTRIGNGHFFNQQVGS